MVLWYLVRPRCAPAAAHRPPPDLMLSRLIHGTPRKPSELLKKELLELQAQVDAEQRELMRLQAA